MPPTGEMRSSTAASGSFTRRASRARSSPPSARPHVGPIRLTDNKVAKVRSSPPCASAILRPSGRRRSMASARLRGWRSARQRDVGRAARSAGRDLTALPRSTRPRCSLHRRLFPRLARRRRTFVGRAAPMPATYPSQRPHRRRRDDPATARTSRSRRYELSGVKVERP